MTLSELYNTLAIFGQFQTSEPDKYNEVFGGMDAVELDTITQHEHGNKFLSSKITEANAETLINSYINILFESWKKRKDLLLLDYDITKPYHLATIGSRSIEIEDENDKTLLDAKKAFNDPNFTDNERTMQTDTGTRNTVESYEDSKSGNTSHIDFTTNLEKEINLRSRILYLDFISELVNKLTIKIY